MNIKNIKKRLLFIQLPLVLFFFLFFHNFHFLNLFFSNYLEELEKKKKVFVVKQNSLKIIKKKKFST